MSKQVDERIVSMQFDNKNFEQNVQTSMSTLDKLKQKLNFKDSAKGFDELGRAAKNVDMSTLDKSVEAVRVKFSALQVAGVTALANITNSAVNAGKNLVKSLSIDQVTAGWNKYEQKTASVQTIMNSTGKSIDEVNQYLEKLMWFSDETSYGFTDMTAALGQMTSSGGDIDKLIPLITGVANATAYAGKGATEFSRVMYNLNQSYGAGHLQLMDWKSLELAGVGSKQLKQTLIDTAVEMGKISSGSVTLGTFAESLKDKWADREVMEAAFGKFGEFSDAVHEMVASGEVDTAAEAIEKLEGKYGDLAVTAFKSAQEAKTFNEAIDATKDAVSSQWMRTMELIFGNYEQAKKIWTDLANNLWDIFAGGGDRRNALLEEALNYSPVNILQKKLEKVTGLTENMTNKLLDYSDITNRIIAGEFGVTEERWTKISEMGYDWMHAQNLVNEKLGDSYRYATDYNEAQEQQTIQLEELTDAKLRDLGLTEEEIRAYRDLEKESKRTGKSINELLAAMKEKDGRTLLTESFYNIGSVLRDTILVVRDAFSEIFPPMTAVQLYNLIKRFSEFTEKLRLTDKATGELNSTGNKIKRTLKGIFAAVDIILTILGGPVKLVLKLITKACSTLGGGILNVTANVGDAIVAFRDWIDKVLDYNKIFNKLGKLCSPVAKKVRDWIGSFDGVDRIKASLASIKQSFADGTIGEKFVNGFKKVKETLAPIGSALVRLAKTIWQLDGVQAVVKSVTKAFTGLFKGISNGVKGFSLGGAIEGIVNLIDTLTSWLAGLGKKDNSGTNIVEGIGGAIGDGVKIVVDAIVKICKAIYNTFCNFFDIHSPSKLMITLGGFLIAGLALGISQGESELAVNLKGIFSNLFEVVKDGVMALGDYLKNLKFSDIKWEHILAVGGIIAFVKTVKRAMDITETFASGFKEFSKIGTFFGEVGTTIKAFREKAFPVKDKWEKRSDNLVKMAVAIGILAASVYALSKVDEDRLWPAVGAITVLTGLIIGLSLAASKLSTKGGDFGKISTLILGLAATLWIMASAIKKLDFLTKDNIAPILLGLAGMVTGLVVLLLAFGTLTKGTMAKNIHKASMVIAQISITMLLLASTIKRVSKLEPGPLKKGMGVLVLFGAFVAAMMFTTRLASKQTKGLAGTLIGMSFTMGLLVGVIKLIGTLSPEEVIGGIACMTLFAGLIAGLLAATKLAGNNIKGVGSSLMGISTAMAIMALTCKIIGTISNDELKRGITAIVVFGLIIVALIKATKSKEGDVVKGAATIFALTIAIGMLAALSVVMSLVSTKALAKGVTVVSILGLIVGYMARSLKGVGEAKQTIVALTVCIGLLLGAVIAMCFIDPKRLAIATAAMGSLLGLFTLVLRSLSTIKTGEKTYKQVIKTLYALAGIIVILGAVLAALSYLPNPQNMVPAATGISIVLLALTGSLNILSRSKDISDKKLLHLKKALVPLTVILGIVAAVLSAMSFLPNTAALIPTATALSIMLVTMTGVTAALSMLAKSTQGVKWSDLAKPLVMMASLGVLMVAFAGALTLIRGWAFNPEQVIGITATMYAMIPLVTALSLLSKLTATSKWSDLVKPLVMLTLLAGELIVFGYALNLIKDFECDLAGVMKTVAVMYALTPLVAAIAVVGAIMNAVGGVATLVSGLVGLTVVLGYVAGVMAVFGVVAVALGALVDKFPILEQFLAKGIGILVQLANGLGQVIGAFVGGIAEGVMNSLPAIGLALSQFMSNAMVFIAGAKMVDGAVALGVATLIGAILGLTVASFLEGIVSLMPFTGSLADMGTQLSLFMINCMPFMRIASMLDPAAAKGVKTLAEALLIITGAKLLDNLSKWFGGGVDFDQLAEQFGKLGEGVANFVAELGTFSDAQVTTINTGAKALKTIAEACKSLPNSGGLVGAIFGENDADTFGTMLGTLGSGIKSFGSNLGKFGKDQYKKIEWACKALKKLATAASEIPNSGGWVEAICGGNDADTFAAKLSGLGTAIKDCASKLGKFGKDQYKKIEWAAKALTKLATAANNIPNQGGWVSALTGDNKLSTFGEQLKKFFGSIKNINVDDLGTVTDAMAKALKSLGKDSVTKMANTIKGEECKTTVTSAMTSLVKAAASGIKTEDVKKGFVSAGKYCVQGLANGIKKHKNIAVKEAKDLAKAVEAAARTEFDEHSPSKKFEEMGMYTVLGLVNGIAGSVKTAVASSRDMAKAVLHGFQDELEIHSPSLVMNEQGHYIVQGVAEGITKDMSAEDAARQKAQNIVDAFDKEISKRTRRSEIAGKEFQLWELTDGMKASETEKQIKRLGSLNGQLTSAMEEQTFYYDQWQEMERYFKKGAVEQADVDDAYNKWWDSQIKTAELQNEINDLMDYGVIDDNLNKLQQGRDTWTTNMDTWLANEGRFATDAEKTAKQYAHTQQMLTSYRDSYNLAIQKHTKALERSGGIVTDEVNAAWNEVKNFEKLIGDTQQEINDVLAEGVDAEIENLQQRMDLNNKKFELWQETDGYYATGEELEKRTKESLEDQLSVQTEQLRIEEQTLELMKSRGATEDEIYQQEDKILDAKIAQAQTQNQINALAKTAVERQREAHEIASETADLQYQIWEKTTGREATSAEKDIAKIGMITKQLSSQAGILNIARDEYRDACKNYGKDSNEAQAAYNAYLNEQLALADLQNEIISIEEKTVEKQKLAKSEYRDYVEKYKKFYELNGMTVDQLEKDAKLVSGYDPNNTVENLVSKTQRKLDDLVKSSEYTKLLDSFSSVGTSYISAINDGVDAGVSSVMDSLNSMLNSCQTAMDNSVDSWEECAMNLVGGFIKGITDNIKTAVEAATLLAIETEKAVREEFDINSPSKVFADISSYAVLGLAKGFIDNCSVSSEAAAIVGDSAVEAMQSTIARISEIVDSDMDTRPTISPVLDLTDVKTGVSTLNSMFSRSQAMDISASMAARANASESQNGSDKSVGGNSYTFNQYNNSPKALSRMDLYRQTKNQFAAMKGATS